MDLVAPSGKLQGALSSRATDIAVFKGIPYAIAPIGARRWTYAEAHRGWQGLPSLAAMRQSDAHELLQADNGRSYRAIVDGKFIPD